MRTMLPSDRKAEKRKIIDANSRFVASFDKNDYIGCRNEILTMKQSVEKLNISAYWAYTHGNSKLAKLAFKDAMNFSKYVDICLFELIDTLIRSLTIENVANDDIGQGIINGDEAF